MITEQRCIQLFYYYFFFDSVKVSNFGYNNNKMSVSGENFVKKIYK